MAYFKLDHYRPTLVKLNTIQTFVWIYFVDACRNICLAPGVSTEQNTTVQFRVDLTHIYCTTAQ